MLKILVLGSSLPGDNHGGGVVTDEVLQSLSQGSYVCFAFSNLSLNENEPLPKSLFQVPVLIKKLYPQPKLRGARFYLPVLRFIGLRIISKIRVKQIINFAKKHSVSFVWGELQGDSVILVEDVAKRLNVPFSGTVWDDPEGWLQDGVYDKLSKRFLWKKFKSALLNAKNISTAGEAMQVEYKKIYGVNSVILRHGFDKDIRFSDSIKKKNNVIKVGFAGSVYGKETWYSFLNAVALYNKSNREYQIKIITYGYTVFPIKHPAVEIENRGRVTIDEVIRGIGETDFCYLPYWFEEKKRRHCELSFPNKFETYIAAGKPIFYHGPEYAGIKNIIDIYGVGICVATLSPKSIVEKLTTFLQDRSSLQRMEINAHSAFIKEFNKQKMINNFYKLFTPDNSDCS